MFELLESKGKEELTGAANYFPVIFKSLLFKLKSLEESLGPCGVWLFTARIYPFIHFCHFIFSVGLNRNSLQQGFSAPG